ncbi:meiotic sister-chromatid recombination protein 6, mitochondrial [Monosporozyma unispora]|nr:Meiotic sister-chromatid recombination- protein 6, mitochondrial [Kazachstania unispora]
MLSVSRSAVARYLKLSSSVVSSARFYATNEAKKVLSNEEPVNRQHNNKPKTRGGRFNSNSGNILKLNEQLSKEINDAGSLTESYNRFNNLILDFESKHNNSQMVGDGYSVFNNTKYLNSTLTRLFKRTLNSSQPTAIDPYQLLNDFCIHHLARPNHFFVLMKYYLNEKRYQDVLNLWVKYLDTIPTFNVKQFEFIHLGIQSYTIIAYLSLGGAQFKPDLDYLLTFLNVKDLDIVRLYERVKMAKFSSNEFTWTHFNTIARQYLTLNLDEFVSNVKMETNPLELDSMYKVYEKCVNEDFKPDVKILTTFIGRFLATDSAPLAMKVFDSFKDVVTAPEDKLILNNKLLLIVAHLGGRSTKRQMIQAVWNTYFKMQYFETPIPRESYCALFLALRYCQQYSILENIWNFELTDDLKQDPLLKQCYLSCELRDRKLDISYNEMLTKLSKQNMIDYPDLIKTILLKTVLDPKTNKDQFMEQWNKYKPIIESHVDPEFIAINILSQYRYAASKDEFNFVEILTQESGSQPKSLIIEQFIDIVPTIHPLRRLYQQLKQNNDSELTKMFIIAEFSKQSGDIQIADSMVKDYIFSITAGLRDYSKINSEDKLKIKTVLDAFIDQCSRKYSEDIMTILKYVQIADKWSIILQKSTIYHLIIRLTKLDVPKLSPETKEIVVNLLKRIQNKRYRFTLKPEDIKRFRSMGLITTESSS